MSQKPTQNTDAKPTPATTPAAPTAAPQPTAKKKLSLEISDVSEVLERKISP